MLKRQLYAVRLLVEPEVCQSMSVATLLRQLYQIDHSLSGSRCAGQYL